MAADMECSERTVRRCIDYLRDVEGWPVESGQAGYRLRDPSVAEVRISSHRDIAALAMAYEALRVLGGTEMGVLIRAEVARACRHAEDLADLRWEDLGGLMGKRRDAGEAALDFEIQGRLTLAILQKRIVRIGYRKLEEDHGFEVEVFPHRLICRDECWYLIAEDLERGGQRTYAVPRILSVMQCPTPPDFVIPKFVNHYDHAFGVWTPFEPGGPLHEVAVELSGYWSRIARERRWHPSQALEDVAPDRVILRFRLSELIEVKSWVLRFGGAARVLSPEPLRAMVAEEVAMMWDHYCAPPS